MTNQNENKRKHLEFIQLTITRMNINSFLVKGWLVALVGAIFVLSQKDANTTFLWYAPLTSLLFWILDGYFLCVERRYRSLYDHVRSLNEEQIDYSMDTTAYKSGRNHPVSCFFSITLILFYPFVLVASSVAAICINY